jgi:hypothetical protein
VTALGQGWGGHPQDSGFPYPMGPHGDPREAAACLSPEDRARLVMADADDFALVNACLRAEGELRERGYAALARLGIVAPGYRGDARSIPALPTPSSPRS